MSNCPRDSIIFTKKENCLGCNKCIAGCPAIFANNAILNDGKNQIEINPSRCIHCGHCIRQCDHQARDYKDDIDKLFNDLKADKKISLLVAPSFRFNFNNHKKIFGYLKSLGINLIFDVSLGADISIWAYLKIIRDKKLSSLITQPCPSIVNYIEKYKPELISKLAPVQSPVICTAIYLRKYKNYIGNLAFLSPCIAKADEFLDPNTNNNVQYNVTFKKLKEYIIANNININEFDEANYDCHQQGLGVIFSRPGGLGENISFHNPDLWISQIQGAESVYDYLDEYFERAKSNKVLPDILDVLNCSNGCNLGTASCKEYQIDDINYRMNILKKDIIDYQKNIDGSDKKYLLFEMFNKELNLSDFIRNYSDKSSLIETKEPSSQEYDEIFNSLHKISEESRNINCYACGYGSCKELAKAIFNNSNNLSSCIYYIRKELEIEQKELTDKNEEILAMFEEMEELSKEKDLSEQRVRSVLIRMSDGVIKTTEKGLIELYNPAIERIFGYSDSEILWKNIRSLIPDFEGDEYLHYSGIDYNSSTFEAEGIRKDGTVFPIEIGCSKLFSGDKYIYILVIRDISERKQIERLKNEFVSIVSHELRTPITSIHASLGLLATDQITENKNKAKKLLEIASKNSVRLIQLLNDILDIEKIEAGKMDFYFEPVEIMPVIDQIINANKPYAKQFNVEYVTGKVLPFAKVNVDKHRLEQVITNLLSNATKFSPPESKVIISVYRHEMKIRVAISDSGPGISKEFQGRIFQKFAQADSSDSRKKGGSGLGLSICKAIIEKMNGKIGFDTEFDFGTTFYFDLPEYFE